jgi:hypothetical protein
VVDVSARVQAARHELLLATLQVRLGSVFTDAALGQGQQLRGSAPTNGPTVELPEGELQLRVLERQIDAVKALVRGHVRVLGTPRGECNLGSLETRIGRPLTLHAACRNAIRGNLVVGLVNNLANG